MQTVAAHTGNVFVVEEFFPIESAPVVADYQQPMIAEKPETDFRDGRFRMFDDIVDSYVIDLVWIRAVNSFIRGNPVIAVARLKQISDNYSACLFVNPKINEFVSAKARKPVSRRKPDKSARIMRNYRNRAAYQTVSRSIMSERKLLGVKIDSEKINKKKGAIARQPSPSMN